MKSLTFAVFTAVVFHVNADTKLRLIAGLNPGGVAGVNPGIFMGGVNPVLLNGGGLIGQPQFAQMVPGVPAYGLQPPVMGPLPIPPNLGLQQPQPFPGQGVLPANGALPYYTGVPQTGNTIQQQVMGRPGGIGVPNQQQAVPPTVPVRIYKRSALKKACTEKPVLDNQIPTDIAPTSSGMEDKPIPNWL